MNASSYRMTAALFLTVFVAGAATASEPGSAEASPSEALEVVRASNEEVMGILAEGAPDAESDPRVEAVIGRVTNLDAMSAAAGAGFTDDVPEELRLRFHRAFGELLRVSALRRMGRYRADEIEYGEPGMRGERALVPTVAWYDGERIEIDYVLERSDAGAWMITNYLVDGVDTIRNYRRQFGRILRGDSFEQLVERLEESAAGAEP